ncbi:hypothetical protein ACC719_11440 [Rhizobium ruizarguesonis]
MPKFRTNEPPEQSFSGLVGLAIVAVMLMLMAVLFVRGDLTEDGPLQARASLPGVDKPPVK